MTIRESGENYLEAILVLDTKTGFVRSIDVANYLGVTKPSVSRAMSILKNGGYIEFAEDGQLSLTDVGREIAEKMYERHRIFTDLLVSLGVAKDVAMEDACRIEHVLSEESFSKLRGLAERLATEESDGFVDTD